VPATYDLAIVGGTVVTAEGARPGTVAVEGERIAAILDPGARPDAGSTLDATGLHVLPGIIDTHVHTRHPGHPGREDMRSGTAAAAAGGITTFLEMPISRLPTNSGDALVRRAALMQRESIVDFGLYGGAGDENIGELAGQAEAGAVMFKTFLLPPPPARRDEFSGMCCTDPASLREIMAVVARTGLRHGFHCEDAALVERLQTDLGRAGRRDGVAHAESRPPIVENLAVALVLAVADEARCPLHVVHLSSPSAALLIRDARRRGQDVTAETCPHYLFLTIDALACHGPFAKCNPALRSAESVARLWTHLGEGHIDVIGSDHSPFLLEEKARGLDDIFTAPPGFPGLETLLPLMLQAVHAGKLTLPGLVRLMATNAAALFHLPGKGSLAPGFDADLTLVDLKATWTLDPAACFSKARDTMKVYAGREFRGRVVSTLVRGTVVFRDGEIVGEPGYGRFLRAGVRSVA
jgi:dihydropyrimidinase/allantoinase